MKRAVLLASLPLLSAAGLGLSIHLFSSHLTVYGGGVSEGLFCGGAGRFDCNPVAAHESAWLLGFPVAGWGVVYFILVAGLSVTACLLRGPDRKAACAFGTMVCVLAFLFDLYLGFVMVTQIGHVCLNCVATYAVNLLLALAFWRLDRGIGEPLSWWRLLPSIRLLRRGSEADYYRTVLKAGLSGLTIAAACVALYVMLLPLREIRSYGRREIAAFLSRLKEPPEIDMSRFDAKPSIGPADAAVTAVLVGDFQCSFCRSLATSMESLRRAYPDKMRVIFVNSPISAACNPAIRENVHADACWLAEAAECAAAQQRFWEYHDFLYRRVSLPAASKQTVLERLSQIGLDRVRFLDCMENGSSAEAVAADIALCAELGLTVTPSVVINGHAKRGSLFPWMLREIVLRVLARS